MGEDIAFCGRVLKAGFVPQVHTGVKTTHNKELWLAEEDFEVQRAVTVAVDPDAPGFDPALVEGAGDAIERLESLLAHLRSQKASA